MGYISSYSEVTHCYSSTPANRGLIGVVEFSPLISSNRIFDKDTLELDTPVTVANTTASSLIEALNAAAEHYTLRGYSHWLCNKGTKEVSFTVNGHRMSITMASEIILLPSLASRGIVAFSGWYTDSACTTPLTGYDVVGDIALYGKSAEDHHSYTIQFDTRGGVPSVVESITQQFGSVAALPNVTITREGSIFLGWETSYGDAVPYDFPIPSRNITLYASWLCTRITTASELIAFSVAVNNGRDYSGTTVLLDNDLDFSGGYSEQFPLIGYNSYNCFNGTFDGQGHTISNLKLKSSSLFIGLFGYSEGTIIQNVVIDGSCSFMNSYSPSFSFIGSIFGYCYSSKGSCIIESVVSMASVSFDGNATYNLYIGGIIGYLHSPKYSNTLRNCVNYGSVTHSGTGDSWVYLGGIVGSSEGQSESLISIQNCLNYGTITHNGSSGTLLIGGIAGASLYTTFDNCVSSGEISTNKESEYIGGIVGYVSEYSNITHCFWTSDVGDVSAYGTNTSNVNLTDSSLVTLNQATLDELNEYASKDSSWSKWVMLYLNGGMISNIEKESLLGIVSALSVPVREGNTFLFWCKDSECSEVFDPKTGPPMSIYAGWAINTVTFDLGNGTVVSEIFTFNTTIEYPKNMVREGHTFGGWDSRPEFMPAMDITIKAQWTVNNYTVTFDLGNGTVVDESFTFNTTIVYPFIPEREGYTLSWNPELLSMPAVDITIKAQWIPNNYTVAFDTNGGDELPTPTKTVTFNAPYGELPAPSRANFTFLGWFNDRNESVTKETIVAISDNHTLRAHWRETQPGYVEIVFGKKDLNEEEIRAIVREYTDTEDFTILVIEDGGSGETRVIVKFADSVEAGEFVRAVNEYERPDSLIKMAKNTIEYIVSLSLSQKIVSLLSLSISVFFVSI